MMNTWSALNVAGLVITAVKLVSFMTFSVTSALEIFKPNADQPFAVSYTPVILEKRPQRYSSLRSMANRQSAMMMSSTALTNDAPLPWSCDCDTFWRDLGDDHFPRFIKDGRCRTSRCWFEHYRCRPVKYELRVMKEITSEDSLYEFQSVVDGKFGLLSKEVTAACQCVRN